MKKKFGTVAALIVSAALIAGTITAFADTQQPTKITDIIESYQSVVDISNLKPADLAAVSGTEGQFSLAQGKGFNGGAALSLKDPNAACSGGSDVDINGEGSPIDITANEDTKYVVFYMDATDCSIRKSWYRLYQKDGDSEVKYDTDYYSSEDDDPVYVQDADGKFVAQGIGNGDGCPSGFAGYKGLVAIPIEYFCSEEDVNTTNIDLSKGNITGVGVTFGATETEDGQYKDKPIYFSDFGFAKDLTAPVAEKTTEELIKETIPTYTSVFDMNSVKIEDIGSSISLGYDTQATLVPDKGFNNTQCLEMIDPQAIRYHSVYGQINGENSTINKAISSDNKYVLVYVNGSETAFRKIWFYIYQTTGDGEVEYTCDNYPSKPEEVIYVQNIDGKFVEKAIGNDDGCPEDFEQYKGFMAIPIEYFCSVENDGDTNINLDDGPITGVGVAYGAKVDNDPTCVGKAAYFDEFGFAKELPVPAVEESTKEEETSEADETSKAKEESNADETSKVKETSNADETSKAKEESNADETSKVKEESNADETSKAKEEPKADETSNVKAYTKTVETSKDTDTKKSTPPKTGSAGVLPIIAITAVAGCGAVVFKKRR